MKGLENVKPEYQEEYERLEAELERFYAMYVEKYTNIDYLEYELDMYNLKDQQRRNKQEDVINKLKQQHIQSQKEEIYEEDAEGQDAAMYDEMRNQR